MVTPISFSTGRLIVDATIGNFYRSLTALYDRWAFAICTANIFGARIHPGFGSCSIAFNIADFTAEANPSAVVHGLQIRFSYLSRKQNQPVRSESAHGDSWRPPCPERGTARSGEQVFASRPRRRIFLLGRHGKKPITFALTNMLTSAA